MSDIFDKLNIDLKNFKDEKKLHKELCFLKASGLSSNKKESLIVILKLVIFRLNR